MDLGFEKAGHDIVWANDCDKNAIETYKQNLKKKKTKLVLANIEDISSSTIPNSDLILGGFPCQGFSIANPYRNEEDKRNKLYLELLRVIRDKKPKFFLAENVMGITNLGGYETPEDKKNKTGRVFKMILNDFDMAGYKINWKIINAVDYGVPQVRKRVIIIGIRKDINFVYKFPQIIYKKTEYKTIKDAIFDLPRDYCDKIPNHQGSKHKVKINNYLGNRKLDWNKPSPTIVGRGGGTGGAVIHPHPDLHRRLTVRECARIQTFDDNFIFYGSNGSGYIQIGNAVPPTLAYYLALPFLEYFDNKENILKQSKQVLNPNILTSH
ncbi:DNA (cytosine-5)-methyltransferase 1 [Cyanobacterium sp. HL-69]|nr:DNA (cytosine-5)-methyltransferase 1 [Cyanobacterium sp. HL-69]